MKSDSLPSAMQPTANRDSSSLKSKTDWALLSSGAGGTATLEHPEEDMHHMVPGISRRGLKSQPAR